jgi:tetratricopeptide (TPR) repeat protein/mono/diheme cytochrome c family protein
MNTLLAGRPRRQKTLLCLVGALSVLWSIHGQAAAPADQVTFTRDIAPLVFAHCASCHRPEGSAPISLLTYADVKRHAHDIATLTANRSMPPWKPEPGYGDFAGTRRLGDDQIALIERWVADGAIEGDPGALPATPRWSGAWRLGEPDLVLTMDRPYTLRASGDDMYRHFVLPIPIAATRYVKAWELRVNNTRVVHHATMEIDRTGRSRRLDEQDPEPGYEGLIAHTAQAPDGYFLDWAPGHTPYVAPEGMSFPIETSSDLVLMLHMRPSGKPEVVQVSVGLYFSATPPTRVPAMLRLTRQDLDIAAGERHAVVTSSYTLPVDIDVFTVQPHAHYLARQIEGFATLPDGSTRWLLLIKNWDFNWQDVYRYTTPVSLPAGTTVVMRWTYDNSADNPLNPNRPPRRVTFGQRTSDEMSELWFQVLPRNHVDRDTLVRGLRSAVQQQNLEGYEAMLRADPNNAALHDDAALLYVEAGNLERAVAHFAESSRLRPDSAPASYNLGLVLLRQGKRDEARRDFQKAVAIDPGYANAYRSLAVMLQSEGKLEEASGFYRQTLQLDPNDAIAHHDFAVLLQVQGQLDAALGHYREAVRIRSDYPDAHYGIALVLKRQGSMPEAIRQYREALRLRPDWPAVLLDLGWMLATAPEAGLRQPEEALRLAERGAELTRPQTSAALDVLAATLASAGRFDQAVETAQRALALATAAANDQSAARIRDRLGLYQKHQPFRETR